MFCNLESTYIEKALVSYNNNGHKGCNIIKIGKIISIGYDFSHHYNLELQ